MVNPGNISGSQAQEDRANCSGLGMSGEAEVGNVDFLERRNSGKTEKKMDKDTAAGLKEMLGVRQEVWAKMIINEEEALQEDE